MEYWILRSGNDYLLNSQHLWKNCSNVNFYKVNEMHCLSITFYHGSFAFKYVVGYQFKICSYWKQEAGICIFASFIGSSIKESWACESLAEFCDTQCATLLASSLWSIALLALFTHLIRRDDHVVHLALQGSRGLVLKDPIWIHIICSCRIFSFFLSFVCWQGTHPLSIMLCF